MLLSCFLLVRTVPNFISMMKRYVDGYLYYLCVSQTGLGVPLLHVPATCFSYHYNMVKYQRLRYINKQIKCCERFTRWVFSEGSENEILTSVLPMRAKQFKWIPLQRVGFEYPHHFTYINRMTKCHSLAPTSQNYFGDKKAKSTT